MYGSVEQVDRRPHGRGITRGSTTTVGGTGGRGTHWLTHVIQQFTHPPFAVRTSFDADSDPVEMRV